MHLLKCRGGNVHFFFLSEITKNDILGEIPKKIFSKSRGGGGKNPWGKYPIHNN
jgi:hypothetical protein